MDLAVFIYIVYYKVEISWKNRYNINNHKYKEYQSGQIKSETDFLARMEAIREEGVQIVVLDDPEIYAEYAPYNYIENVKDFVYQVGRLNKAS